MAVEIYDQAFPSIDGNLLGEATNVQVTLSNEDQFVKTLVKQFAGKTIGPRMLQVQIDSMILSAGLEFDVMKYDNEARKVELTLRLGGSGKVLKSQGFLSNTSVSSGVGENSKLSFTFDGEPAIFQ